MFHPARNTAVQHERLLFSLCFPLLNLKEGVLDALVWGPITPAFTVARYLYRSSAVISNIEQNFLDMGLLRS